MNEQICPCCGMNMVKSYEGATKIIGGVMNCEWRWRCFCTHAIAGGMEPMPSFFDEFNKRWDDAQDEESIKRKGEIVSEQALALERAKLVVKKREAAKKAKSDAKAKK